MPTSYGPPPSSRILLAATPAESRRLERLLDGHELVVVQTRDEAIRRVTKEVFQMIVIGVHFDESQMFALLSEIRAHGKYRKVPILCVLDGGKRTISDVAIEGLDHAVKAMTANGFMDLNHFPDDEQGNTRVRRIIDYLILINGDLQHLARAQGQHVASLDERRRAGTSGL